MFGFKKKNKKEEIDLPEMNVLDFNNPPKKKKKEKTRKKTEPTTVFMPGKEKAGIKLDVIAPIKAQMDRWEVEEKSRAAMTAIEAETKEMPMEIPDTISAIDDLLSGIPDDALSVELEAPIDERVIIESTIETEVIEAFEQAAASMPNAPEIKTKEEETITQDLIEGEEDDLSLTFNKPDKKDDSITDIVIKPIVNVDSYRHRSAGKGKIIIQDIGNFQSEVINK